MHTNSDKAETKNAASNFNVGAGPIHRVRAFLIIQLIKVQID